MRILKLRGDNTEGTDPLAVFPLDDLVLVKINGKTGGTDHLAAFPMRLGPSELFITFIRLLNTAYGLL